MTAVNAEERVSVTADHRSPPSLAIAIVAPGFPPAVGGIEAHVGALARHLGAAGHRVDVLYQGIGATPPTDVAPGVSVRRFRSVVPSDQFPFAPGLAANLRRRAKSFDVVHVHGYHSAVSLAALALPPDVPVVFTPHFHGGGHTALARAMHVLHRPLGRRLMARADRVICVSKAEARLVSACFPSTIGKLSTIRNGVSVRVVGSPEADRPPTVLSVGRLERYKRVDMTVRALRAMPGWRLVVVGDGPTRAELTRLGASIGIGSRLTMLGPVDDAALGAWLGNTDVFVSMSEHEAFGIAVLEAAIAGIPVVASAIPAHRELAELAGGAISLVPSDIGPDELASAVRDAARRRITTGLASALAKRFSWVAMASATVGQYIAVTGRYT